MLIGICGKAGSGKDTAADFLVNDHHFVKVALADPLKRICKEVFDFSDEQLWGPSEKRNEPDKRYNRGPVVEVGKRDALGIHDAAFVPLYLTPRYALQQLGTEWGRNCYPNVWVDYAIRVANILTTGVPYEYTYTAQKGLFDRCQGSEYGTKYTGVVVPDVRFQNEIDAIRKAGGFVVRITRPKQGLSGAAGGHASETEQDQIPDSAFDMCISNDGSLAELHFKVEHAYRTLGQRQVEGQRADHFANALACIEGHPDPLPPALQAEVLTTDALSVDLMPEVKLGHDPIIKTEDGVEVLPENYNKQTAHMQSLLDQRAEDVKNGRLLEYDPEQANIPPFKRRK